MNKLFRPKCMRRMAVFMALVAPIVYLFGSLFFALNGAHGTEVFAEPVYVDEYIPVSTWSGDDDYYRLDIESIDYVSNFDWRGGHADFDFDYMGSSYNSILRGYFTATDEVLYFISPLGSSSNVEVFNSRLTPSSRVPLPASIYFYGRIENLPISNGCVLNVLSSVPSGVVVENSAAYSDYIFKNFFAKDNFLVQWGENAISENPYGFAPFGYFWRYLDVNVLHLSNDQAGLMAYGYMYYASHVLLFDVGFILVTFFLTFIQKVADKIGGEDHA